MVPSEFELSPALAGQILQAIPQHITVPTQIDPTSSPEVVGAQTLFAYVISPNAKGWTEDDSLTGLAARQIARELLAETIRQVQHIGSAKAVGGTECRLEQTGQPVRMDVPDVAGAVLMGDPSAATIAVYLPRVDDVSYETSAQLDSGEIFHAFMRHGAVIRLRIPVRIEIADPALLGLRID